MQFGRYFDEFEVGATYRHWPGKTITEYDDHLFCLLTMNHHPLHTDTHYAETQTQFGRNVVVGNLVYSLALGMSVADISGKAIANLEVESLKHENPTFHGDTIYAETTVLDKRESASKPDRGVVTVETRALNQRGERVCVFRRHASGRAGAPGAGAGHHRRGDRRGAGRPRRSASSPAGPRPSPGVRRAHAGDGHRQRHPGLVLRRRGRRRCRRGRSAGPGDA